MNNIYILNKNYKQIGVLSNQGANPQAPYYEDLYIQELDTGADTYQFSTISSKYTQDLLEIGNHVMFSFNNRNEIFTITSLEYSHYEGYKTIGVYAEGIGFELLEVFMERPPIKEYPSKDDDNTDDEYANPNDIYIDKNGNIIYDKDGSGPPKKDDVYIDEDGFIIYKPDKKKEKNDSLEFKNISFPTFLKILLKNTGWKYTCQSGLSSVKHNISVRYDTNIYAVLQDSMQAYRGVELEFVHEMRNGKVQKIVKAYKDGGRGSVVGKRFEYGTNVKGITKTQEVTDSEDDTVLYVDDVGVKVYYDVDFALKSAEIPEIEIGDTHYVIDKDFYPPMTIKARIGKIEISFTDPTKNKIYLANNKNIRGSSDEEDIRDVLDDYFDDEYGDDPGYGDPADHDHCRLISRQWDEDYCMTFGSLPGLNTGKTGNRAYFEFRDYDVMFSVSDEYKPNHWLEISLTRSPEFVGSDFEPGAGNDDCHGAYIYNSSGDLIPESDNRQFIGRSDKRWHEIYAKNLYAATSLDTNYVYTKQVHASDRLETYTVQSPIYFLPFDRKDMIDVSEINDSSEVSKQDLLDFILNDIKLHEYMHKEEDADNKEDGLPKSGTYLGLLSEDYMDHRSDLECDWKNSKVAKLIMREMIYSDSNNNGIYDGDDAHETHVYNLPALVVALIGAFQQHVENGGEDGGSNPGDGGLGIPEGVITYTEDPIPGNGYRLDFNADRTYVNDLLIANDGMNVIGNLNTQGRIVASNGLDVYGLGIFRESLSVYKGLAVHNGSFTVTNGNITANGDATVKKLTCDSLTVNGKEINGTGSLNIPEGDTISVKKIIGGNPAEGERLKYVEFEDAIAVKKIFHPEGDGSVEWENDMDVNGSLSVYDDTHIDGDLYVYGSISYGIDPPNGSNLISNPEIEFKYTTSHNGTSTTVNSEMYLRASSVVVPGKLWVTNGIYGNVASGSDISLKENIRYIDDLVKTTNDDLLEKTDLHDFIVNQIDLCEFNYIGDDSDKIGFIANDYEGTKVGDKIVSRNGKDNTLTYDVNNLLFATIGALQEEVRIRDEKIASLEARLAKIEEMLGINNN